MVTAPAEACTSTVLPSASVVSCIDSTDVPRLSAPLARAEILPEVEVTSASISIAPPRVCSRMLPLPLPTAVELIAPDTRRLPVVSTSETSPEFATMPPRIMPSGASAGGRVLAMVKSVASLMNTPPLVISVATRVPSAVCSAAPDAPMPVAAYKVALAASPVRLALVPVRLSLIAPALLLTETLLVTVTLLRAMLPTADKLARPLVPTEVILLPSAIVMAAPATRVASPPLVPSPPEIMSPPWVMDPAVAVRVMLLPVAVAFRSMLAAVVIASAAVSTMAP